MYQNKTYGHGLLYRAKPVDTVDFSILEREIHKDGLVYGNLIVNGHSPFIVGDVIESNDEYIALEWWCPVESGSIEQFTGYEDSVRRCLIYEGDYVVLKGVDPLHLYTESILTDYDWTLCGKVVKKDGSFVVEVDFSRKLTIDFSALLYENTTVTVVDKKVFDLLTQKDTEEGREENYDN